MSFPNSLTVVIACLILASITSAEEGYQRTARDVHNQYRSWHHVGALNQNDDLNNRAVQCAQYYASKGGIDHSCPHKNGAGENLWATWGGNPPAFDNAARSAFDWWYSESAGYDYNADYQPSKGHFSQMVWKNSRDLGFGLATVNGYTAACALYNPPGYYLGQFQDNVLRP